MRIKNKKKYKKIKLKKKEKRKMDIKKCVKLPAIVLKFEFIKRTKKQLSG